MPTNWYTWSQAGQTVPWIVMTGSRLHLISVSCLFSLKNEPGVFGKTTTSRTGADKFQDKPGLHGCARKNNGDISQREHKSQDSWRLMELTHQEMIRVHRSHICMHNEIRKSLKKNQMDTVNCMLIYYRSIGRMSKGLKCSKRPRFHSQNLME